MVHALRRLNLLRAIIICSGVGVAIQTWRLVEVVRVNASHAARTRATTLTGGKDALGQGSSDANSKGLVQAVDWTIGVAWIRTLQNYEAYLIILNLT